MIKAPIKRDTCQFQSITQSENTKTLQKKEPIMILFSVHKLDRRCRHWNITNEAAGVRPHPAPQHPPFLLDLQRSPLVVCYLYNERGDSLVREILRTLAQKASHLLKCKLRSVSQCYLTSGILDFKLQHKRAKYRNDMLKK